MRKVLAVCAGWLLAGLVLSAPTSANANAVAEPDCRTSTSMLTRPDHGHGTENGGYWATLKIERTTTICVLPPADVLITAVKPPERALYRAVVVDEGTLVTIAGENLSPNEGKALNGDVPGFVVGGFKVDFAATAGFLTYQDTFGDKTYSGIDSPVSTGKWVSALWGADDFAAVNGKALYDWGWNYWTCTKDKAEAPEFWWDAEDPVSSDGTTEAAGDITGKFCPSASPSPSASATPTASVSTAPPAASNEDSLPVTGVNGRSLLGWAVLLIFSGGLVYWLFARIGRKTFEGRLGS